MPEIITIGLLGLSAIIPYLLSLIDIGVFLPQLIALLSLLFIIFNKYKLPTIYLVSLIINLIIFSSSGVLSPFFFLIYFLLFIVAFLFPPTTSLSFSLILILLLSQTLSSLSSFLTLFSLVFITPIAYLISLQIQKQFQTDTAIAADETNFLLWLNLKFKTGIKTIIDTSNELLPISAPPQSENLKKIKTSAKSLLNSAAKLSGEIDANSDEI